MYRERKEKGSFRLKALLDLRWDFRRELKTIYIGIGEGSGTSGKGVNYMAIC